MYAFCEVMDHLDLKKYFAEERRGRTGRPRYDRETLVKLVLFAFMEDGYEPLRKIEEKCKYDLRYRLLRGDNPAPSFMTVCNFINNALAARIDEILIDINNYIFKVMDVDLNHVYIDGTKIIANANKYSWVWKRCSETNQAKTFAKVSALLGEMNKIVAVYGVKFGTMEKYAVEYLEQIQSEFVSLTGLDPAKSVRGRGHHKSPEQRLHDLLVGHIEKLRKYAEHIKICGDERNSYSKTDHDATFMRVKKDYMRNDQLLPAYNIQIGTCDEFIAVCEVMRYASDMDCFVPVMEKFNTMYGMFPEYPVADAGYGSFNNYLFCAENGMKKYMKFTMYDKETSDKKYRDNPYRAVNFPINENGCPVCPGGKEFHYLKSRPVKNNRYGREEELWKCENCADCPLKAKCCKCKGDRVVQLNKELTAFHKEVVDNLNCIHGLLLRKNRSIQAEGVFGTMKWNRSYTRARRRGILGLKLEISLIACGFNLHKFHLKLKAAKIAA